MPLRIYSLTLVLLIDAIFPEIHHKMVEKLNKSFLWSTNKFNKLKIFYLFIEIFVLYNVIKLGTNNTFIEYIYSAIS